MKVQILQPTRYNGKRFQAGDTPEVDRDAANGLIAAGSAEPFDAKAASKAEAEAKSAAKAAAASKAEVNTAGHAGEGDSGAAGDGGQATGADDQGAGQ